jgi:hypothetical protein
MLAPRVPSSKIVPLLELELELEPELELELESSHYNKFALSYMSLGDSIVEV